MSGLTFLLFRALLLTVAGSLMGMMGIVAGIVSVRGGGGGVVRCGNDKIEVTDKAERCIASVTASPTWRYFSQITAHGSCPQTFHSKLTRDPFVVVLCVTI